MIRKLNRPPKLLRLIVNSAASIMVFRRNHNLNLYWKTF